VLQWRQFAKSLLLVSIAAQAIASNSWLNPDPYLLAVRQAGRHNYASANSIWEKLSSQGDCDAAWQLGLSYFMGYGVQTDTQKALNYWKDAANRGQPRAEVALADVYFRNPNTLIVCSNECGGLAADSVEAYKWYLIAQKRATNKWDLDYLGRAMPHALDALNADQRASAEQEAMQWQPTPEDCHPRKEN
jgi:TPR repeat protein